MNKKPRQKKTNKAEKIRQSPPAQHQENQSLTESSSSSEEEKNLQRLIDQIDQGDQSSPAEQQQAAIQEEQNAVDLETYRRLVKPTCILTSWALDKLNRRFLKSEFVQMDDRQIALLENDLSHVLKDAFDNILPEVAKKNPRLVSIALILGGIYAANTKRLPPPSPPAKQTSHEQTQDQSGVHSVEIVK